jgi:hypothetical protein
MNYLLKTHLWYRAIQNVYTQVDSSELLGSEILQARVSNSVSFYVCMCQRLSAHLRLVRSHACTSVCVWGKRRLVYLFCRNYKIWKFQFLAMTIASVPISDEFNFSIYLVFWRIKSRGFTTSPPYLEEHVLCLAMGAFRSIDRSWDTGLSRFRPPCVDNPYFKKSVIVNCSVSLSLGINRKSAY